MSSSSRAASMCWWTRLARPARPAGAHHPRARARGRRRPPRPSCTWTSSSSCSTSGRAAGGASGRARERGHLPARADQALRGHDGGRRAGPRHRGRRFFALLGPSGCGKTTTLRMIGGFEDRRRGSVALGGEDVTERPPFKRDVNTVFQSYALFPHLDVERNVAFGLERRKVERSEARRRVAKVLELTQLTGFEKRKPEQLSGGQHSASRSRARWSTARARCCSTSRSAPWTCGCAGSCSWSSSASSRRSGSRSCT